MGRKKHAGDCYICGKYDTKLTRDHIPPQCFAPLPLQTFTQNSTSKFQYAWACKACNETYGKSEKTFKNFMLMGARENIQAANDALAKFLSENRKSKERYGTPSKEFLEILAAFPSTEIYSPGGLYLGNYRVATIKAEQWSWLKEEYIKIAKGLHTSHTKEIIPQTHEILVMMNEKIVYPFETLGTPTYYRFDTDFFEYCGYVPHDYLTIGIWYMRFYKGYTAQVCFRP